MQPRQEARGLALNVGEDPGVTNGGSAALLVSVQPGLALTHPVPCTIVLGV